MPEKFVVSAAEQVAGAHRVMLQQMQRVIIGQQEVLDLMLLGLFCQGHCILEGVPGLAKTLMISSLSQLLSLRFQSGPVHARPDAVGHYGHRDLAGRQDGPAAASCDSSKVRYSPI